MKIRFVPAVFLMLILTGFNSTAQASAKTILALGDSITAGAPAFKSPAEVPPEGRGNPQSQYAYWLHVKYPAWKIVNRGISAQTSADILGRLERELNQTQPQIVILMAGVNDIYRGTELEILLANLKTMYEEIQARGIPLMVLTVLPYRDLSPQKVDKLIAVNRWIRSYAEQHQLGFCDTFQVMNSKSRPFSLTTTRDGIHPDLEGYRVMGQAIADALEKWETFQELSNQ